MNEKLIGTIAIANYHLEEMVSILLNDGYAIKLKRYNDDKVQIQIYEEIKNKEEN